jgi:hypothetical protein
MQGLFLFRIRPPERLAIEGNASTLDQLGQAFYPGREARAERGGVQLRKNSADGVVRRDAIFEIEKGLEEITFLDAIVFDLDDFIAATDHGTDRQADDIPQGV